MNPNQNQRIKTTLPSQEAVVMKSFDPAELPLPQINIASQQPVTPKHRKVFLILAALIVIIAIACASLIALSGSDKKKQTKKNTASIASTNKSTNDNDSESTKIDTAEWVTETVPGNHFSYQHPQNDSKYSYRLFSSGGMARFNAGVEVNNTGQSAGGATVFTVTIAPSGSKDDVGAQTASADYQQQMKSNEAVLSFTQEKVEKDGIPGTCWHRKVQFDPSSVTTITTDCWFVRNNTSYFLSSNDYRDKETASELHNYLLRDISEAVLASFHFN